MANGASGSGLGLGASRDRHVALLLNETRIQADNNVEKRFIKLLRRYCKSRPVVDREVMERAHGVIGRKMNIPAAEVLSRIAQLREKFVNFQRFLKDYDVSYNSENNKVSLGEKYLKGYMGTKLETPSMKFFRMFGLLYYRKLLFIFFIARADVIDEEPYGLHADHIEDRESDREYMKELNTDDEEEKEEESDGEFAMAMWRRF